MTTASAFAPERFDVLARQLTARVNAVAEQQFEDVLVALLPVWVAWNSL